MPPAQHEGRAKCRSISKRSVPTAAKTSATSLLADVDKITRQRAASATNLFTMRDTNLLALRRRR